MAKHHDTGYKDTPLFEERFEDVVWSVEVHWQGVTERVFLYLLIEFQSTVDPPCRCACSIMSPVSRPKVSHFINSKSGFAWPSLRTLAKKSMSSLSSVKRALKQLATLGFLQIEPGGCRADARRATAGRPACA